MDVVVRVYASAPYLYNVNPRDVPKREAVPLEPLGMPLEPVAYEATIATLPKTVDERVRTLQDDVQADMLWLWVGSA